MTTLGTTISKPVRTISGVTFLNTKKAVVSLMTYPMVSTLLMRRQDEDVHPKRGEGELCEK